MCLLGSPVWAQLKNGDVGELETCRLTRVEGVRILSEFLPVVITSDGSGGWLCTGTAAQLDALCELGLSAGSRRTRSLVAEVQRAFDEAESVELLSLDPRWQSTFDMKWFQDSWLGYDILGSTSLRGEDKRQALARLWKGVDAGSPTAPCFEPRHGLRTQVNGRSYELMICFQCSIIRAYIDGKKLSVFPSTSPQPRGLFNLLLKRDSTE